MQLTPNLISTSCSVNTEFESCGVSSHSSLIINTDVSLGNPALDFHKVDLSLSRFGSMILLLLPPLT